MPTNEKVAPWLNTATGRRFNFLDPKPEDIDIVDIAIALGSQARYAGHTRRHYSVATHSAIIARTLDALGETPDVIHWGLLHDAAEAYVTDIPWPLKAAGLVEPLKAVERAIMVAVAARFGLSAEEPAIVKELDLEILDLEASSLMERHPDWPRGTPRVPREALRVEWRDYYRDRCTYHEDPGARDFVRLADRLGLATTADYERVFRLMDRP